MYEFDRVPQETNPFIDDFKSRLRQTKKTRWLRFSFVFLLFCYWVNWIECPIWYILLPLIFDIYITKYIPFGWWKKSKNETFKTIMGWVDAITYSLVIAYLIFNFLGQNYKIPSSSLEKTLLTGDYLWVDKTAYGLRMPMAPIHFPLTLNSWPIFGGNSYSEKWNCKYRRLKGGRKIKTGDIVVFNCPAADTVATRYEGSFLYYDELVREHGWDSVNTDRHRFGQILYRPVDRRVNFVKRAVGLPGERIKIVGEQIFINGTQQKMPTYAQFIFTVALTEPLTVDKAHYLGIALRDIKYLGQDKQEYTKLRRKFKIKSKKPVYFYRLPLTAGMAKQLKGNGTLIALEKEAGETQGTLFPVGIADRNGWSLADYGGNEGLLIPKKGMSIPLNEYNWLCYHRCIRNYENHPEAYFANGKAYIAGKEANSYTFEMDYYFMMGDNRHMSQDSRFWGFVPEDHVIGRPTRVLLSFDQERSVFSGGLRGRRTLKSVADIP